MFSNIAGYIKLLRITNWPKNFFVFVPAVFSKHLFEPDCYYTILLGFITFSIASSAVYVVNDIVDAPKDAVHPLKKNRPIPSGAVTKKNARILASIFFLVLFAITLKMNYLFM
ncbi:MAG: UbiA family prenyltransferase, partial [Bacteroidota bacterium]